MVINGYQWLLMVIDMVILMVILMVIIMVNGG